MFESFYTDSFHISWQPKKTTQTFPMANPVVYPFRSAGEITEKSEVYSLGMVLLEASSDTTVATSTHGWLGFLLDFFCQLFLCKAKKHFAKSSTNLR